MGSFQIVDHTADLALRISGINREDLFQSALDGLIAMSEADKAKLENEKIEKSVTVNGADDEELLVRFLNEMIDIIQDEKLLPVQLLYLDFGNSILRFGLESQRIVKFPDNYVEIKAATYHMLKINRLDDNLTITVIFDV